MGWHGRLTLDYTSDGLRTLAHDRHVGPLRVLQRLYPEGPRICHHVLVHPPGGIVGGDELDVALALGPDSHALLTTPGATRYYRSDGALARQHVHATLAAGSRLEWLPLETMAYRDCIAENRLTFDLAPGAEMIGWEMLALGLPAADQAFDRGRIRQHLELPGVWLESALVDGTDAVLLDSPLGFAGQRVLGTLWFTAGTALDKERRSALLDDARATAAEHALARRCGTTSPDARVAVCRVLGPRVEPVFELLRAVRARWRATAWQLDAAPPRIWAT